MKVSKNKFVSAEQEFIQRLIDLTRGPLVWHKTADDNIWTTVIIKENRAFLSFMLAYSSSPLCSYTLVVFRGKLNQSEVFSILANESGGTLSAIENFSLLKELKETIIDMIISDEKHKEQGEKKIHETNIRQCLASISEVFK